MAQLTVNLPDDLARSVRLSDAELEAQVKLMAALKMFELGKLSSGKAAELAGLSRRDFLDACARYRVSVANLPAEDLEEELRSDVEASRKARP